MLYSMVPQPVRVPPITREREMFQSTSGLVPQFPQYPVGYPSDATPIGEGTYGQVM